jgi:outer membrane lipoprotein-sorting protein
VLIGFDGTTPRRLELVDGLNHVTRIELDNLAVNPELGDDVFEFEVPAGVDVIGDEG